MSSNLTGTFSPRKLQGGCGGEVVGLDLLDVCVVDSRLTEFVCNLPIKINQREN